MNFKTHFTKCFALGIDITIMKYKLSFGISLTFIHFEIFINLK